MRSWFTICNKTTSQKIATYTSTYICGDIIKEELALINQYCKEKENFASKEIAWTSNLTPDAGEFSLKTRISSTTDILARYTQDEVALDAVLTIPDEYPLLPVTVTFQTRGFKESLKRKWLLSMTTLLKTKDARVLDAVLLWRDNIEKQLDGIELCPICYSIFHVSDKSLPNMECSTCNYKYHSACMV